MEVEANLKQIHLDVLYYYNTTFQALSDEISEVMFTLDNLVRRSYNDYFITVSPDLKAGFKKAGIVVEGERDLFIFNYTQQVFGKQVDDTCCEELAFKALEFHINNSVSS